MHWLKTHPWLLLTICLCAACQGGQDNFNRPIAAPVFPVGFQFIATPDQPGIQANTISDVSPNSQCTADQVKLLGHLGKGSAMAIAWASNKPTLEVSSSTGTYLYDVARKVQTGFLDTTAYQVANALYTPDGAYLALASTTGVIHLWRVSDQKEVAVLDAARRASLPTGGNGLRLMTFTADSKLLATIDVRDNLLFWQIPSGVPYLATTPLQGKQFQFFQNDTMFALTGSVVRTYRTSDGKIMSGFNRDSESYAVVSPDGIWMVEGTKGILTVWQLALQQIKFRYNLCQGFYCPVPHSLFSPTGHILAVSFQGGIQLWDPATRQQIGSFSLPSVDQVVSIKFSPDEKKMAVVGQQGIYLYDIYSNRLIRSKLIDRPGSGYGDQGGTDVQVDFSNDSQQIAHIENGNLTIWSTQDGRDLDLKALEEFYDIGFNYYNYSSYGLALKGTRIDIPTAGGNIKIWDLRYGAILYTRPLSNVLQDYPGSIGIGNGGNGSLHVASDGNTVTITRTSDQQVLHKLIVPLVISMVFSPDDKLLATSQQEGMIRIWDMSSGKSIAGFNGGSPSFSPDGSYLVSYENGQVNLNRTTDWAQVMTIDEKFYGEVLSFWPDLNTLMMTGGDTKRGYFGPRLVNVLDGRTVLELPAGDRIYSMAPPLLAVVHGFTGTVELWGCR